MRPEGTNFPYVGPQGPNTQAALAGRCEFLKALYYQGWPGRDIGREALFPADSASFPRGSIEALFWRSKPTIPKLIRPGLGRRG